MYPRSALILTAFLTACGGGGGDAFSAPATNAAAAINDLTAATGTPASTSSTTVCGYDVGPKLLEGTVTSVHDGDTLTVNGVSIRLDSIDAPELAQTDGAQSQVSLSRLVLGQQVKVAYAKYDKYGRVVGAVFTATCQFANLAQVASGSAWFYRAYQCEISAASRNLFDQAESSARAQQTGLWAQANPTPPWVFRNGVAAVVPVCSSNTPSWMGNPAVTSAPASASPAAPGCTVVDVRGYYRSDGTYVPPYTRNSPGCA